MGRYSRALITLLLLTSTYTVVPPRVRAAAICPALETELATCDLDTAGCATTFAHIHVPAVAPGAPGQQQTPPGQQQTPPGQQQTPPGQQQTPPGQQRTNPPNNDRPTRAANASLSATLDCDPLSYDPLPDTAPRVPRDRPLILGVTIADASDRALWAYEMARQAGFTHVYVAPDWASIQPAPDVFAWDLDQPNELDRILEAARVTGLRLIIRLGRPPEWVGPPAAMAPEHLESFAAAVAGRAAGVAEAYEVLNEPNLDYEWGGTPDPAAYARLLAAAARGIRSVDTSARVIAAGLAPATGGQPGTLEDVDFLRALYAAGARDSFDVLGIHPYGGNTPPHQDPKKCTFCFRRGELYRQLMIDHGDAAKPAWITEFGYLHTTTLDLGDYNWLKLSPTLQATYLTAAYSFADHQWPWLDAMVVFNLDFSLMPWNTPTLGANWFALLNADGTPRPAYLAIRQLRQHLVTQPIPTDPFGPLEHVAVAASLPPSDE